MTVLRLWTVMPGRGRAAAGIAAGAATILAGIGLMTTAGYLIARAAERPPILDLMVVFVAVRFFGLARPALRYVERLVSHDVTFRALRHVRRWFYDALLPLSPARVMDFRAGDLLSRVAHDIDTLQEIHLRLVAPTIVALGVCSIVIITLSLIDTRLALVTFALLFASGVLWPLLAQRWTRGLAVRRARERAALTTRLVPTLQGLQDLLIFGRAGDAVRALDEHQRQLDRLENVEGDAQAAHAAVGAAFAQIASWTALAMTIPMALDGRLSSVWIAAIALGIVAAFEAVDGLPAAWQFKERLDEAAARVFAVFEAAPAVSDGPGVSERVDVDAAAGAALAFEHVTFAHRGEPDDAAAIDVLRDVTFSVAPGERVAIVGPSGGGKSTLLSLAMRVWDPASGRITLDGHDLRAHRLDDLRASMAVMPQQVCVFNDTLRENARLLRPEATDEDVVEALRRAGLGALFETLPRGLDEPLGEQGDRLSAGERQRLGIARLLLSRATLAIVDEPTANLDTQTERDVLRALHTWAHGRTLLLVTHRLVSLDTMDRILVIDRGRVVEQGSYATLVARNGLFAQLLASQHELVDA